MNRRNSHQAWQLENLETRQLLSAGVPAIEPLLGVGHAVVAEPMVRTPNIVGTWTGTAIRTHPKTGGQTKETFTITVTRQTSTGKLKGTVQAGDHGTFTGTIKGDSVSLVEITNKGWTQPITGTVSANGKVLSGTWSNNQDESGTFSVSR